MRIRRLASLSLAGALALSASAAAVSVAAPGGNPSGVPSATQGKTATVDSAYALVQLSGDPLATAQSTRPGKGKKVDFTSRAVKNERARLAQQRNAFKAWLRKNAPDAKVSAELDVALHAVGVQLNGTSLETLRKAPGVSFVELQGLFTPTADEDPQLAVINGMEAWAAVGRETEAGEGVKVAIIDSGIDISHPCFDDAGYPETPPLGDDSLTNNKVIVAKAYSNKLAKNGYGAEDLNGHGTHVAGTVACNAHTPATIQGKAIPYDPSGVAPAAQLGNYNVFPGESGSARSQDILLAMQDAYADGFDVANMSLGGGMQEGGQLLVTAIENLDKANMVIAVAAGNEGPGYFTVHWPGAAERALTVGASNVGHAFVNQVSVDPVIGDEEFYDMVIGEFLELTEDLTAPLAVVADPTVTQPHKLSLACNGTDLGDLDGSIAVIGRGSCTFQEKVDNAEAAHAVGVIVVNVDDTYITMAGDGLGIPAVFVTLSDGQAIADHHGEEATLHSVGEYQTYPDDTNLMASFSSWGPTPGTALIKPDVVAPGGNILSAAPAWACDDEVDTNGCWAFNSGTSMATPHVAGIAAVVRGEHPTWTAAQVRSAVVNTAQQGVLRIPTETGEVVTNDAFIVGAGLADAYAAVEAAVALDPVSLSFGSLSSGAGRSLNKTMTITNTSLDTTQEVSVTLFEGVTGDVSYSVEGGSATLEPGESTTVTVTAKSVKRAAAGAYQGQLDVSVDRTVVAHAMVQTLVGQGLTAPGQWTTPPGLAAVAS